MSKREAYAKVQRNLQFKMFGWAAFAVAGIVIGVVTALPVIGAGVPLLAGAMVFNAIMDARGQAITIRHS